MIRRIGLFAAVLVFLSIVAVPSFAQSCPYDPYNYPYVTSSCTYAYSPCATSNAVNFTLYNYYYYYLPYTPRSCETVKVDFGDGSSATTTTSSVQHTYAKSGAYIVKVTDTANDNSWTHGAYTTTAYVTNGYITFPSSGNYTFREDVGSMHFEIDAPASTTTTSVQWETVNGTAVSGTRFSGGSGTLAFAPGETKKYIDLALIDDTAFEGSQNFQIRLFNPNGDATLPGFQSEYRQNITIYDNDPPPTLNWSQPSYKFNEGGGTATLTVNRTGDMSRTVQVNYYVSGYTSGSLTFNANETSKNITFALPNDNVYTGNRTTYAELSYPTNGAVFATNPNAYYLDAQIQILEDDPIPMVSIDDITTSEGNSGSKTVNFTVTMTAGSSNYYTYVNYTIEAGSARFGSDFTAYASSVYMPSGTTSATIPITIYGDTDVEPNETFTVVLTSVSGCCASVNPTIAKARGTCTILNDDFGMGPANLGVPKGGKGTVFIYFGGQPQTGNDVISLTSSNTSIATVPASVNIPAASNAVSIDVSGISTGSSQITAQLPASLGSQLLKTNVNVYEPATMTFQPESLTIPAGTSKTITVKLDPPPSIPWDLRVQTTNSAVATVPGTVNMSTAGTATLTVKGVAKGSSLIAVTMPAVNGGSDVLFPVQVVDPPNGLAITQIAPPTGPSAGGTSVTISGQNLANTCTFTFGGTASTNTAFASAASMTTTTPAHPAGPVDVVVTCGTDQYTLAAGYTYTAATPQLTSVTPGFGSTAGGTVVTVNGSNLRSSCGVFFDNMTAKILSTSLPDKVTVEAPAHSAGTADLSLRCTDSTATLKSAFTYTTADEPSPSVSDIDPLAGSVGQRITIRGSRFRASDVVTFGDTRATVVSTASDSHVVEVPSVAVGKIAINLADANGHLTTTGPIFSVLEPVSPQITNVTPSKIAPGGQLVIEGRGFRAPYTFSLDGRKAGSIIDLNFTRAIVRVSSDMPAGTYNLGVVNGDGQLASTGPRVDVVANALVAMNVSPQCARADGGTEITINGNGFTADSKVTVGGATATNVRFVNDHMMKANVPEGVLGWSDIVVSNPNGDASTLARAFFYYSPYDNSGGCTISRTHPSRH